MKECFLCGDSLSAPGLKLSRKKLINSRSGFTLKFVFTPKESKKKIFFASYETNNNGKRCLFREPWAGKFSNNYVTLNFISLNVHIQVRTIRLLFIIKLFP